jgi:carbamoyltransferase
MAQPSTAMDDDLMTRYYVGLAATFHDPALAIVDETGKPLFAEATERKLQNKRAYNAAPDNMLTLDDILPRFCERGADIVAAVTWSDHFHTRLMISGLGQAAEPDRLPAHKGLAWPLPDPEAFLVAMRCSIGQAGLNLAITDAIEGRFSLRRFDHHLCHAALAAFGCPFDECVVAVVDGFGERTSTSFYLYDGKGLQPIDTGPDDPYGSIEGLASLGEFYGRLCALCGFDSLRGEEWKVMGLAPYGRFDPDLEALLAPMLQVEGLTLRRRCSEDALRANLGRLKARRRPDGSSPLLAADLAATGQALFERRMFELLGNLHDNGLSENLALVGGCALNSTCNGRILANTGFKRLHVPSAPGDDGTALGAALLACRLDRPEGFAVGRRPISPYLGSEVSASGLERLIAFGGLPIERFKSEALHRRVAELLAAGQIVAWMRGRAEYGPRALGNRSILADPRDAAIKDRINERIKFREEFRPFAPAILDEHGPDYFEDYQASPYMERTLLFRPEVRRRVPAVVHVDGSGRLQSVRRDLNPDFHALLSAFFDLTGVPILLNTSLNVMGKPIVDSVEDALGVFFLSGVDALVIGDRLIRKTGGDGGTIVPEA